MTITALQRNMDSNQIVEQFIHSCSHDLRAPLTSIRGLVKVADYYPQSEEVSNCFRMIENCTDTMDKLIRALEEFMVINHYVITPEAINYDVLTENIMEDYQDEINQKSISVRKNVDLSESILTDRVVFSLIFKHLFKNAISFQDVKKRDKHIDVTIESEEGYLKLQIKDNGIGINPAYYQKIFKPFFKASTQSKGVGMGLFLLNNLLNKINGSISFKSEEQAGTTITVLIPDLN